VEIANAVEARIKELVESLPDLAELVEPLLVVRRTLREQIVILHRRLLAIVRDDEVCQRLMTTPGVGPVVALTYRATVDVPARFRKSKAVGAGFGLTCTRYQSGEIDWSGRISRCGDEMMRMMLYEAAQSMMRSKKMVMAQGLGHADRQAPRDEEGDRGPGTPASRDHAPNMG
jgi:transposase